MALPVEIGLTGEEGYPHQGKVDFLDNQLTPSTGTIRMRALLDNAQRQFTPGLLPAYACRAARNSKPRLSTTKRC
jgi:multidrug efflux system membrane fusion protein